MKETYITFWKAFREYPPYYVRLLAKSQGNGPHEARSDAEIAIASGLPINRVREISRMEQWDTVTYAELLAFTAACSFDPTSSDDRRREKEYSYVCKKRGSMPFQYLRKHPKWHSEFLPLVKLLAARMTATAPAMAPVHA